MSGTRAAIRYAKAVLELANSQNTAEAVHQDMALIANTIAESKDLSEMLESPVISLAVKKSAVLSVFNTLNTVSVNLIDVLAENKRLSILEHVANKYNQLYDELKGTKVATVTTAVALTSELEAKVLSKIKTLTGGNNVDLQNVIDETIIGGFILRVGDLQYDASIANKLNKLKQEFTLN